MIKYKKWQLLFILALISVILQSCLGIGDSPYQNITKGKNGDVQVNVAQAAFKGNIYFTLDRNLYVLNGNDKAHPKQLTHGIQVRDPAVSPDKKWIAFTILHPNYSDLAIMPINGGKPKILISGNGTYIPNDPNPPKSTAHWIAQPAWAPDSKHVLFLSDLIKDWPMHVDTFLLDLQLYQVPIDNASQDTAQIMAYAVYGDGGLRDPGYRPGHPDQIIYTNYQYDASGTKQVVQIELENASIVQNDLATNPYAPVYHPDAYSYGNYPSVPITPGTPNLMNLQPAFSPDGNTIIYVRRNDATHMSLYTMSVPDGVTGPADGSDFDPQDQSNQAAALKPYNHAEKLLTKQYLSQPIWSPDSTQIAYYDYSNTSFDLWLATMVKNPKTNTYTIKTDSMEQLTMAHGDLDADSRPCWTS